MSPNGRWVVGYLDGVNADRAWVYDTQLQQFQLLPLLPGLSTSIGYDVNDAGQAVGKIAGLGGDFGFVYQISTGQYTLLHPINPEGVCEAFGITSQGVVCGTRSIGSKGDPVFPKTAFTWSETQGYLDLGVMNGPNSCALDIADDGTVVGWTGGNIVDLATRAFVWEAGDVQILPPVPNGFNSYAVACDSLTSIVVNGRVQVTPSVVRCFTYSDEAYLDIGVLPGFETASADDVTLGDVVVGVAQNWPSSNLDRGFIWQAGMMRNLDTLLPDVSPFTVTAANAVAPGGAIAARAISSGDVVTLVLTPVYVTGDAFPDCRVDVDDLLSVITSWGERNSVADVTGDGDVDIDDLILVVESWTF